MFDPQSPVRLRRNSSTHPNKPHARASRYVVLVAGAMLVGWTLGFTLGWGVLAVRGVGDHE